MRKMICNCYSTCNVNYIMIFNYLFQVSGDFLDRHLGGVMAHDPVCDCEYEYDVEITDSDIDEFCEENGIDREELEEYYDGPDPIGKTHVREGVVVRIVNRPKFAAYKHKNFSFKVLEGIIKASAEAPDMEEIDPEAELNALVGLESVKNEVQSVVGLAKLQQIREERGIKVAATSKHMVFTGNPGTGKPTVARILAAYFKEMGILSKGHLVEVDRSDLVAEYVGQTAVKTQKKIKEALGGILFIDEAYTLNKDGKDFGQELKAIEARYNEIIEGLGLELSLDKHSPMRCTLHCMGYSFLR